MSQGKKDVWSGWGEYSALVDPNSLQGRERQTRKQPQRSPHKLQTKAHKLIDLFNLELLFI